MRFYRGDGTDSEGRRLEDILRWDDQTLEYVHDFIQWLFPLDEPSAVNPNAPLVTRVDRDAFAADETLAANSARVRPDARLLWIPAERNRGRTFGGTRRELAVTLARMAAPAQPQLSEADPHHQEPDTARPAGIGACIRRSVAEGIRACTWRRSVRRRLVSGGERAEVAE